MCMHLLYQYIVEFTLSIKRLSCIEAHQGIINFKEGLAICIITALTLGLTVPQWTIISPKGENTFSLNYAIDGNSTLATNKNLKFSKFFKHKLNFIRSNF